MQRKPDIRWRTSDVEKLEREVKRFNAKISRLEKKHPELASILPERINKRELMENIKYRSTFNRELKSLDRFSKRGAEKPVVNKEGVSVTKWERKETAYKYAQWNRELARQRKEAEFTEVTSQGKPTGLKRGEMGSVRMKSLEPRKFDFEKVKSNKEWEKLVSRVDKNLSDDFTLQKMERFKENYIQGLENVFGESGKDLIEKVKKISPEVIVNTFYSEQEASIDFIYDPIELAARLDVITGIWSNVTDG